MTLQDHQRAVDSLQRRADERRGKRGYEAALERLRQATLRKLAAEIREGL